MKTRINTVDFRHGLTLMYTVYISHELTQTNTKLTATKRHKIHKIIMCFLYILAAMKETRIHPPNPAEVPERIDTITRGSFIPFVLYLLSNGPL